MIGYLDGRRMLIYCNYCLKRRAHAECHTRTQINPHSGWSGIEFLSLVNLIDLKITILFYIEGGKLLACIFLLFFLSLTVLEGRMRTVIWCRQNWLGSITTVCVPSRRRMGTRVSFSGQFPREDVNWYLVCYIYSYIPIFLSLNSTAYCIQFEVIYTLFILSLYLSLYVIFWVL